jgi:glycosyltransferase involved in cell wall biosynthesis
MLFTCALIAVFWVSVAVRVGRSRSEDRWRLGPDSPCLPALPRLTVLIPARNEAANIGPCLDSVLASDHGNLEVVVFDDSSTDGTAELARSRRAKVVAGSGDVPAGWKGKPWALHRAWLWLERHPVKSEWLLFLDADVRLHPSALSRAHSRAITDGVALLSGFGKLEMVTFWEKVIQPSVGGLILAGNDLDKVNDPARQDAVIANGQFILVRADAYRAVGGHRAVAADILDDVGLARAFVAREFTIRVLFMRELFSCRMYTSLRELWLGWTKNLYAGMRYSVALPVALSTFIAFEFVFPYFLPGIALAREDWVGLAAAVGVLTLIHGVRYWMDGIFGQERSFGLLQGLGAAMLVAMLLDSVRRARTGNVLWKGRKYSVTPEDETSVVSGVDSAET